MNKNLLLLFVLCFSALTVFSQKKKEVLLTIDDTPVYVNEFIRVYNKNLDLVKDETQKSVDGYLDLFIDYKLKVAAAYEQGLDKDKNYVKEFNEYRNQLSKNYIFEDKVTSELAVEAYQRGLEEINADHILIMSHPEDKPQDTLIAYNKINEIRKRALKGEDFEKLAKETSEEPNANQTGGKLGYFSVFNLVYPFESMAYKTKVGDVSEIVKTQYGYHIIKVNDRRERTPEITVSHIMLVDNEGKRTFNPEERINELYKLIQQGESFETLAKQYSDDKNSAKRGGKLNPFSKGDLRSLEFEEAAYSLKKVGDVSKPIKSDFGWHIIRLDEKHAIPTFEEKKEMLEKRVKEGGRSKIVTNAVNKKLKEKYGFIAGENYMPFFETFVTNDVLKRAWKYDSIDAKNNKVIFTIGDKKIYFSDFASYISERQKKSIPYKEVRALLVNYYDEFETEELKNYFRDKLEQEDEEFAAIVSEYRDGLLIFDVMNKNVWNMAKKDSVGLMAYYEKHKENYLWDERIDGTIISGANEAIISQAKEMLAQGTSASEIKEKLNTDEKINVLISEGIFEKGNRELPASFDMKDGISPVYVYNDGFTVVKVNSTIPAGIKTFDSIKGKVMSEYQNYLEKQWIEGLRNKYEVDVNKKTLKKVKKELKS
jgi:peptidyl-prolyl cis-trans isomerase SurA